MSEETETRVVVGKAAISSDTIWSILGMLATYFGPMILDAFTSNAGLLQGWLTPMGYQIILAVLMVVFGAKAVKSRIGVTEPITGILTATPKEVKIPMTYVKE